MILTVKICGINTEAALDAALDAGADYIGLVFYPRSPRHVDCAAARRLADRARGRAKIVALTVDAEDGLLDEIVGTVRPDVLQLHGRETRDRVESIGARFALPIIKAIKVESAADVLAAATFQDAAVLVLFDAKPPDNGDALPGGNGQVFDWTILAGIAAGNGFMLSGGLTPDTVAEAIRVTGARAVDVSSGVETRPGEKDPELIRRFIGAAKGAKQPA